MDAETIQALFRPETIAVIGASADLDGPSGRALKYLLRHRFSGRIFPVNPRHREVAGLPCYASAREIPGRIDLAFVAVPAGAVGAALEEAAACGARAALVLTAGLVRDGDAASGWRQEVGAAARRAGIRLCGPNSMGVLNCRTGLALSASLALETDRLLPGAIGFISQSGSLTGSLLSRAQARGIGFSLVASSGDEADLDAADFLEALAGDPDTRAIMLFLEGTRDARRFGRAADLALACGKPVVLLKLGRSAAGRQVARSHTGSLAGDDRLWDGFCRQHGILRVEGLEELLETASLLARVPPREGRRIGLVTTTGGAAALVADACGSLGLEVPPPSPETADALKTLLPPQAPVANPLDVTLSGLKSYEAALDLFLADPNFDIVVAVIGSSGQFFPEVAVKPVIAAGPRAARPLVAYLNPEAPESLRLLEANGVPSFRTPEGCARALRHLIDLGEWRGRRLRAVSGKAPR